MSLIILILFAIGLCFDSFAVSLSSGMTRCLIKKRTFFRFALILGVFQGVMPLIGWLIAERVSTGISAIDHWISFVLLALLGAKMIKESFDVSAEFSDSPFQLKKNCLLGIATSIDALISGIAMAFLTITIAPDSSQFMNMVIASAIIFVVTFIFSIVGLFIGKKARGKLGSRAEMLGGIILILIGLKILIEHLLEEGI